MRRSTQNEHAGILKTLLNILLWIGGGYAALAALLYVTQDRFVFPGTREHVASPADRGWHYEDVMIDTEDGETLHSWWLPVEDERGALLFFHGNAGNLSGRLDSIEQFRQLGLSVLIIDYRGYGRSTGSPSEEGLYRDARAAWRHLTKDRGYAPKQIVIFGRSLGSGPATWLTQKQSPGVLILESPFTSVPDIAARQFPMFPVRLLARTRFNNMERISSIGVPLLVTHSPGDRVIPFSHGRAVYEAASEPKAFMQIEGGHNDGFLVTGEHYTRGIDAFLKEHFDPQAIQRNE